MEYVRDRAAPKENVVRENYKQVMEEFILLSEVRLDVIVCQ